MRVFTEVVDLGSQRAAADKLDMSRAMVSRYLAEMEDWLGARLLHRTTRHLSLTDAGEACLARCRQVLEQIGELECSAGQRAAEPRGLIRVTAATSFAQHHLAAAVTDYVLRYPATKVDLLLVDRAVNLVEERVDLAIRITNDLDPTLVARRLSTCRSVVCAAPAYLARHGQPRTPAELAQHNCLTYTYFGRSEWRLHSGDATETVQVSGNISMNEATVLAEAALAGAGIAMLPTYLIAPMLADGRLVAVLPGWHPPEMGIYGVYASRRFVPPTLRTLLAFIAARFGDAPYWDKGQTPS